MNCRIQKQGGILMILDRILNCKKYKLQYLLDQVDCSYLLEEQGLMVLMNLLNLQMKMRILRNLMTLTMMKIQMKMIQIKMTQMMMKKMIQIKMTQMMTILLSILMVQNQNQNQHSYCQNQNCHYLQIQSFHLQNLINRLQRWWLSQWLSQQLLKPYFFVTRQLIIGIFLGQFVVSEKVKDNSLSMDCIQIYRQDSYQHLYRYNSRSQQYLLACKCTQRDQIRCCMSCTPHYSQQHYSYQYYPHIYFQPSQILKYILDSQLEYCCNLQLQHMLYFVGQFQNRSLYMKNYLMDQRPNRPQNL